MRNGILWMRCHSQKPASYMRIYILDSRHCNNTKVPALLVRLSAVLDRVALATITTVGKSRLPALETFVLFEMMWEVVDDVDDDAI